MIGAFREAIGRAIDGGEYEKSHNYVKQWLEIDPLDEAAHYHRICAQAP
jgi:DNA-binding SARP family transcriptional activator